MIHETNERQRIHWLRIEQPTVFSQIYKKDGHNVAWKASRTGRIGFRFRDDNGTGVIEIYEEFSYQINTSLPKLGAHQLQVQDAREVKIIGTLYPGLNPTCDEKEKLIGEIAMGAADNHCTEVGTESLLLRFLLWAIHNDSSIMFGVTHRFPNWKKEAKDIIEQAKGS